MTAPAACSDFYPLSSMQQGMLYQTLASPGDGTYTIVVSYRLKGALDVPRFVDAWQAVVNHQPVLRTSFDWVDRTEAVQIVHPHAPVEWRQEDWRQIEQASHLERLQQLLEAEQRRGFDLSRAPLLRLTIIRCGDDVHEVVLSHHHILMDGSCKPILFTQVFAAYEAMVAGRPVTLERAQPFRRFVEWVREQPMDEAEAFWKNALQGFGAASTLWPSGPAPATTQTSYGEHRTRMDLDGSNALRAFGRSRRLTLGSIVSGVWALALARCGHTSDVVFGTSVNVRPPDLDGIDAMLGLFINTLPVRARLEPQRTVVDWLAQLQRDMAAAREFRGAALSAVLRWSDVPAGQPLFESIVVFENNAGYDGRVERYGDLEVVAATPVVRNSLPLTLRCVPLQEIECHLLYDARRFSAATAAGIASEVQAALTMLPRTADGPLRAMLDELATCECERRDAEADVYRRRLQRGLNTLRRGFTPAPGTRA